MVSLFMDMSSELVHGLLPIFMTVTLGASPALVGLIEGFAEATASFTKLFSGAISDRIGKRKVLIILGYGLAAVTKPLFPLAGNVATVVAARGIDRVGKGIRGAPRDALIADLTPPEQRGAAYGLRQSMDTMGAILGPLAAIGLMFLLANNIRAVLWFALIPAALAILTILFFVKEPDSVSANKKKGLPSLKDWGKLGKVFWQVVAIGGALTLARFSEAFLVLRANGLGLTAAFSPMVLVVMSVTYALTAYPAGLLADKMNHKVLLAIGLVCLIVADVLLAFAPTPVVALIGIAVWGIHMGLTQGVLSTMIADAVPADLRGTGFGVYSLLTGFLLLAASALAGGLWVRFGPATTFLVGGAFAMIALGGVAAAMRRTPKMA